MENFRAQCNVVVLTKNEEQTLAQCLASLHWCGEIVVVDSASVDRTAQIAREMGARVLEHVQQGVFKIDEQRNWALEHGGLKGEWVLFLDADEEVTDELAREIQRVCNAAPAPYNAYELTPKYLFWGRWLKRTQGYPNWHARLLKLGEGVRFEGGVWEHFSGNARVGKIRVPYNHYANAKGLSDWLARHDRYSSWDAQKTVSYLESKDAAALGTSRKLFLRELAARFWFLRPFARFFQMYFYRLGFLEGFSALVFCSL
ncbi:MAG: glycosyltransferase family 2 protein, partial [bacterium]